MENNDAAALIKWLEESGTNGELMEFARLCTRSALNGILAGGSGAEIYTNRIALKHNLIGQASAICLLAAIRAPDHEPMEWPKEEVSRTQDRTLMVYVQLLHFISGFIKEQNSSRKVILTPFTNIIQNLIQEMT